MASFLRTITSSFCVIGLKGNIFETAINGPSFIVVIVSGYGSQRPSTLPSRLKMPGLTMPNPLWRVPSRVIHYTINHWSREKQLVLFSRESRCFSRRNQGKHRDSIKKKYIAGVYCKDEIKVTYGYWESGRQ